MANTPSAAKRARQTKTRTLINRRISTAVKTQIKAVRKAMASGDKTSASEAAKKFVSTIDKAVKTGNVHRNSASRHKGAIAKALAALK